VRLTAPFYFEFGPDRPLVGSRVDKAAWEALRMHGTPEFALDPDRSAWETAAHASRAHQRLAGAIGAFLRRLSARTCCSYGVGRGMLEYWLAREWPEGRLTATELDGPVAERLEGFLAPVRVVPHDLGRDPPLPCDLHLLVRVDTEFSQPEWRALFRRFAGRRLLVVPAQPITLRSLAVQLRALARGRGVARAGWCRNRAAMRDGWGATHKTTVIRLGDHRSWSLEPLGRDPGT
jgi:hypothetical protein